MHMEMKPIVDAQSAPSSCCH